MSADHPPITTTGPPARKARRVAPVAGVVVALIIIIGVVSAIRSPDQSSRPSNQRDQVTAWEVQGVDQFANTIARSDVVVVNVHVPDQADLPGTDLDIPYTRIVDDKRLPADKTAPIAIYCRSGRMSKIAAQALVADGRRNLIELDGGMNAWEKAGRSLVDTP
jgi:rhodanese-related sulfurtransferase